MVHGRFLPLALRRSIDVGHLGPLRVFAPVTKKSREHMPKGHEPVLNDEPYHSTTAHLFPTQDEFNDVIMASDEGAVESADAESIVLHGHRSTWRISMQPATEQKQTQPKSSGGRTIFGFALKLSSIFTMPRLPFHAAAISTVDPATSRALM